MFTTLDIFYHLVCVSYSLDLLCFVYYYNQHAAKACTVKTANKPVIANLTSVIRRTVFAFVQKVGPDLAVLKVSCAK